MCRLPLAQAGILAHALKVVSEGKDAEEVKAAKTALVSRLLQGPPGGVSVEVTHRNGGFDDAYTLLTAVGKILLSTDADALKALASLGRPAPTENPLAALIKEVEAKLLVEDLKTLGPAVLPLIDTHFPPYTNGSSMAADAAELEAMGPGRSENDRMLLKIRMSDKYLLLCLRAHVCGRLGVPNDVPVPRSCENCRNFRGLLTCSHCGTVNYCSRACQTLRWKEHKRLVNIKAAKPAKDDDDPIAA